ncbi:MAG: two-component system response regulator [Coriobacteriaceae bacterium]|nr:two-component system response regulator [Coriobacteriaceae bacterium]
MPKKILAVDDEPSIVKLVTATLQARGYQVTQAFNGEEALDKVRFESPDLIVLDVMMPRLTGPQVRDKLAADPKTAKIPILFLSAVGDMSAQLGTMESGEGEYMTKPFKPSELADYVEAMLDPSKRGELAKHRSQQVGKLRTLVEIMHRSHGGA